MKVGDLVKVCGGLSGPGIIVKIESNTYLIECDGSPGSWYHIFTDKIFLIHRMHNLEVISESNSI